MAATTPAIPSRIAIIITCNLAVTTSSQVPKQLVVHPVPLLLHYGIFTINGSLIECSVNCNLRSCNRLNTCLLMLHILQEFLQIPDGNNAQEDGRYHVDNQRSKASEDQRDVPGCIVTCRFDMTFNQVDLSKPISYC